MKMRHVILQTRFIDRATVKGMFHFRKKNGLLLCLPLVPFLLAFAQPEKAGENNLLTPTRSQVTRSIEPGSRHDYRLQLTRGDHVYGRVLQLGADIALTLIGEGAQVSWQVDGPTGARGEEPFWLVAPATGSYELRVECLLATPDKNFYELSLDGWRPATDLDRTKTKAFETFRRGVELLGSDGPGAIELFETSIVLWKGTGHSLEIARAYKEIAGYYHRQRAFDDAREAYRRALDQVSVEQNCFWVCLLSYELALHYRALGEMSLANDGYRQVIEQATSCAFPELAGLACNDQGPFCIQTAGSMSRFPVMMPHCNISVPFTSPVWKPKLASTKPRHTTSWAKPKPPETNWSWRSHFGRKL